MTKDPLDAKLYKLTLDGEIRDYAIYNVSEDGKVGPPTGFRNTERLMIIFNSGEKLIIGTFCTGINEDTVLTLVE